MSLTLGFAAEERARDYLKQQGLHLIISNYRCKMGEIDLIMRDKEYFVFVEVRARSSLVHGSAIESITYSKQQKIIKTATFYLLTHGLMDKHPVRFDVVTFEGKNAGLNWVRNAFST